MTQSHPKVKLHHEHNVESIQMDGDNGESTLTKIFTEHVYCHRQEDVGVYEKDPWVVLERKMVVKQHMKNGENVGEPVVERTQKLTGPGIKDGKIDFDPEDEEEYQNINVPSQLTQPPVTRTEEENNLATTRIPVEFAKTQTPNTGTGEAKALPVEFIPHEMIAKPQPSKQSMPIFENMDIGKDNASRVSIQHQTINETLEVTLNETVIEFFEGGMFDEMTRPNNLHFSASIKYPAENSADAFPSKSNSQENSSEQFFKNDKLDDKPNSGNHKSSTSTKQPGENSEDAVPRKSNSEENNNTDSESDSEGDVSTNQQAVTETLTVTLNESLVEFYHGGKFPRGEQLSGGMKYTSNGVQQFVSSKFRHELSDLISKDLTPKDGDEEASKALEYEEDEIIVKLAKL